MDQNMQLIGNDCFTFSDIFRHHYLHLCSAPVSSLYENHGDGGKKVKEEQIVGGEIFRENLKQIKKSNY